MVIGLWHAFPEGVPVGVAVAVAVGAAVAVAVAVGVGVGGGSVAVGVGVGAGVAVAVGVGVPDGHDSVPMVMNVPGLFCFLYSAAIQSVGRFVLEIRSSSTSPLK